jgi:hypothetical protein
MRTQSQSRPVTSVPSCRLTSGVQLAKVPTMSFQGPIRMALEFTPGGGGGAPPAGSYKGSTFRRISLRGPETGAPGSPESEGQRLWPSMGTGGGGEAGRQALRVDPPE